MTRSRLMPHRATAAKFTASKLTPYGEIVDGVTTSVGITAPSSDLFEIDQDHILRALVGGWLARQWWSFVQGGTTYAVHYAHGGSSADPTTNSYVPALSTATAVLVDLGAVARTGTAVATLTVTALGLAGVTGASSDGANITVAGSSDLTIPPDVDTTDTSLRGMRGMIRDDWGDIGGSANTTGGSTSTVIVHLGQLGDALNRGGRVIASGVWGAGGFGEGGTGPRMGVATGGAYSTDPGLMTLLGEGRIAATLSTGPSAAEGGTCSAAVFAAAPFGETDEVWVMTRVAGAGGIRYRAHGRSPVGRGTLPVSEAMMVDVTVTSAVTAFGATYTPTVVQVLNTGYFNIYGSMFVVVEFPDASGNYPANGNWDVKYGDQNPDRLRGTQVVAPPAVLTIECTGHREDLPQWTNINVVSITRSPRALAAGESSRGSFYDHVDVLVPAGTAATLIADAGIMTLAANTTSTTVLDTPIAMGTEVIGANRTIALTFNYATTSGAALASYELGVWLETGSAATAFVAEGCWEDDPELWHDGVRGSRNRGAAGGARIPDVTQAEYRTRTSTGNTGMPTDDLDDAFPSTMSIDTDAPPNGDDAPWAIASAEYYTMARTGFVAVV